MKLKTTTINEIYNILKERKEIKQNHYDYIYNLLREKYGITFMVTGKLTEEEKTLFQNLESELKTVNETFNDFCSQNWNC